MFKQLNPELGQDYLCLSCSSLHGSLTSIEWPIPFMFYSGVTENEPYGNILLFYVFIDKMCVIYVLIANVCPHITKKTISARSSKV